MNFSFPCDIVINHDIIRIFSEVRISSSTCDILINHDIIRIFYEVRISSSPCDIVINHDIIRIFIYLFYLFNQFVIVDW